MAFFICSMKLIPLTQGKFATVDDYDFDFLNQWKWHAHKSRGTYYAERNSPITEGKRKTIQMHRQILGLTNPKIHGDHWDGDGLNNQRENLRVCDGQQNAINSKIRSDNSSGFKGVSFHKLKNKFQSRICIDKKQVCLGHFSCPIQAARAYDEAAKIHYGEFARLNFPT